MATNTMTASFIEGMLQAHPTGSEFITNNWVKPAKDYKRVRFGQGFGRLFDLLGADWRMIQEFHHNINLWSDADIQGWKTSYVASCNAIAVAAAIFATLGLTALQLPNVNSVHWTARAFFSLSMLSGILSVVSATTQQRVVGSLKQSTALRLYLSRGAPRPMHQTDGSDPYPMPYCTFPLESSFATPALLNFPRFQLNLSVIIFLIGFLLYLILSWAQGAPDTGDDYRNIFIVFIIFASLLGAWYSFFVFVSGNDAGRAAFDFDVFMLGAPLRESEKVQELERSLKGLHQERDLAAEIRDLTKELFELRRALVSHPLPSAMPDKDVTPVQEITKQ